VIPESAVREGLRTVRSRTGLKGRWQVLGTNPLIVADTGHNEAGLRLALTQLLDLAPRHLHVVFGVVRDKDLDRILALLPPAATYYFCHAAIPRALPASELQSRAATAGLHGQSYDSVMAALTAARAAAHPPDAIYVGGSTFVVAEVEGL
ncbi:MAG TPA: cyanophycin synthetase, partial [bacterium]|nr:cyanophycin synthetase [bacterium]